MTGRASFYRWHDNYQTDGPKALEDSPSGPSRVGNRIPNDIRTALLAPKVTELLPRELAVRFTDGRDYFVSETRVYHLLTAHDQMASPAFIVVKAASGFPDKKARPNEMWEYDLPYFKIIGWGWMHMSAILDDYTRHILAAKRCSTIKVEGVTDTQQLALIASGHDQAHLQHKPQLLGDSDASFISGEMPEWLGERCMKYVRGAPCHPQTQYKIERWHQTFKTASCSKANSCPATSKLRSGPSSSTITTKVTMNA